MKKEKIFSIGVNLLICLMFFLTSCREEVYEMPDSYTEAIFMPSIQNEEIKVRAVDNTWTSGDKVGICMLEEDVQEMNFYQYQAAGGGNNTTLTPSISTQKIYFPPTRNVKFVAFSPYSSLSGNNLTYDTYDQSDQKKMEAVDVLYSETEKIYNRTSPVVNLQFRHLFSRLIVKVETSQGIDKIDLSTLSMEVTNLPRYGTVSLNGGTVSLSDVATVKPYEKFKTITGYEAQAIVLPHPGKANRVIRFTVKVNNVNTLYTYTFPENYHFEAGKLYSLNFKLTTNELARNDIESINSSNCYVLPPGGKTVYIPVNRANEYTRLIGLSEDAIDTSTDFTASLIWSDNGKDLISFETVGKGSSGLIKVTSNNNSGKVGNAVIAVKVGGEIKWSWHIWITDYDPNDRAGQSSHPSMSGCIAMDRDLGATNNVKGNAGTLGLLYQYGRKDPFPGSDAVNSVNEQPVYDGVKGVENSTGFVQDHKQEVAQSYQDIIKIPYKYITSTSWLQQSYPYDFYIHKKTWSASLETKGIQDPCPHGWRVSNLFIYFIYNEAPVWNEAYSGWVHQFYGWVPKTTRRLTNGLLSVPKRKEDVSFWLSYLSEDASELYASCTSFGGLNNVNSTEGMPIRCIRQ